MAGSLFFSLTIKVEMAELIEIRNTKLEIRNKFKIGIFQ